nr:MAG TPA: hypothetical protein [Caudoviricetes sp.]
MRCLDNIQGGDYLSAVVLASDFRKIAGVDRFQ